MSYTLRPRNKAIEPFRSGAFFWSWLLTEGVGLPIGCGRSIVPAMYRYTPDRLGRDPMSNDGFHVLAKQARVMATCARGLLNIERGKHDEYSRMSPEEQQRVSTNVSMYRMPVRSDWLEGVERFVTFAEQSGGFWIR